MWLCRVKKGLLDALGDLICNGCMLCSCLFLVTRPSVCAAEFRVKIATGKLHRNCRLGQFPSMANVLAKAGLDATSTG